MPDMPPIGDGNQASSHVDDDLMGLAETADEAAALQGYVSDAELMAWLETKSNNQYDELRDQMSISTNRQQLIEALSNLKSNIEHADSDEDVRNIKQEMKDLLGKYKNTPFQQDVSTLLEGPLASIDYPHDGSVVFENVTSYAHDIAILAELKDPIASANDKLGKIDSLALVQIQELVSDAKETAQLASNVLSSRDQTSSGIIGNIRG